MSIDGIIVNPETDTLIESRAGRVINGYSATREIRETPDGRRYAVVVTHPDGRTRVELEADGVRWVRYPSGSVEGTRLEDGAPVEPTRSPVSEAAAALGRMGGASTSPAKRAACRANGTKGGRPAWRALDRWDVDDDGAEDMVVADGRRTILLCRRHNLGAADPATWCVAFDATGVANVRASVAASGEHISQIAFAPLAWDADAVARVARAAERNA